MTDKLENRLEEHFVEMLEETFNDVRVFYTGIPNIKRTLVLELLNPTYLQSQLEDSRKNPKDINYDFVEDIKRRREEKGYTQTEMADKLGEKDTGLKVKKLDFWYVHFENHHIKKALPEKCKNALIEIVR